MHANQNNRITAEDLKLKIKSSKGSKISMQSTKHETPRIELPI
jgi:hypothetical protein